jgi:hypothetical protein
MRGLLTTNGTEDAYSKTRLAPLRLSVVDPKATILIEKTML